MVIAEGMESGGHVGKNIHRVLDDRLLQVQKAMEDKLAQMTLADVKKDVTMCIEK